jgi:hypothetical protein
MVGKRSVLAQLDRQQRYGQMRHPVFPCMGLHAIEQPLAHIRGVVVTAYRTADLFQPVVQFGWQHRRWLRSGEARKRTLLRRRRRVGQRSLPVQSFEQGRRDMLAAGTYETSAIAGHIVEFAVPVAQGNIDRIGCPLRSPDAGTNLREIVADLQRRNASLRLIDVALAPGRTAEEIDKIVLLQAVRRHVTRSSTWLRNRRRHPATLRSDSRLRNHAHRSPPAVPTSHHRPPDKLRTGHASPGSAPVAVFNS